MMMEQQQQAPSGTPSPKHDLCQMTLQLLMSPACDSLKVGDACPGCRVLDGRFAPVCVHPSAPAGNKINLFDLFISFFNLNKFNPHNYFSLLAGN